MNSPARSPGKHPAVDAEIRTAAAWYEERCPGLGHQFIDAVQTLIQAIHSNPLRYAIRFADIRRANLHRFPYAIWFFLHSNQIFILAVSHNKRDSRSILEQMRVSL